MLIKYKYVYLDFKYSIYYYLSKMSKQIYAKNIKNIPKPKNAGDNKKFNKKLSHAADDDPKMKILRGFGRYHLRIYIIAL